MAEEFSAKIFQDMPKDKFRKEAERLGIDLTQYPGNLGIDAVYNAALRERQEKAERVEAERAQEQEVTEEETDLETEAEDYEAMTVAQLRELAADRGLDIPSDARKVQIIAELREDDAETGDDEDTEAE